MRSVDDVRREASDGLATGPFGSSVSAKYFRDAGVPLIRGSNLSEAVGERLVEDDYVFVSEEKAAEFPRAVARVGDLIFTCWGTIGQVGLIDGRARYSRYLISNKQMKLSPDSTKADSLFLYYLFKSPNMQAAISGVGIGSSVPGFNLGQLRGLRFPLPPIDEQQAIAAVLGSLDDKIEQNRRTGRALEGLARATFKAWFVDFEPVRAKAAGATSFPGMPPAAFAALPDSLTDSPIGPLPQGWEAGSFGSVMSECNARNRGEEIKLVLSAVSSGHLALSDEHFNKRVYSKSLAGYKVVETGAVAFNPSRVNIGSIGINHRLEAGVVSPVYVVCSMPREFEWFFELYLRLPASRERFVTLSSGSVRQSLRAVDFLSIELVLPDHILLRTFNEWYESIRALNDALAIESSKLAALRDYLLPRLLSGQVWVADRRRR